jgi:hypothetical protein
MNWARKMLENICRAAFNIGKPQTFENRAGLQRSGIVQSTAI